MDVYRPGGNLGAAGGVKEGSKLVSQERRWGHPSPASSPALPGLGPAPHLHSALLLHCLLLALPRGGGLGLQLLQLRFQLLARGHRQGALLAFLIPLHLCIPQLGVGAGGMGSGHRRPRLPLHAGDIAVHPLAPAQACSPVPPAPASPTQVLPSAPIPSSHHVLQGSRGSVYTQS